LATRLNSNIEFLNTLKNSKKPGLKKIIKVLLGLNSPHLKLKNTIIISGTNGKGTVGRILNEIYSQSGYSVGLYTSPHLISITERLRIKNKNITLKNLDFYLGKVIESSKKNDCQLSYFELLTATAILYFSIKNNDINIFEVGLGGRYDATNVIKSRIGIITNVEMDHAEYLGDTLDQIAYEKAGITNKDSYLITSVRNPTLHLIKEICKENKTKIYRKNINFKVIRENNKYKYSSDIMDFVFKSSLQGEHQIDNFGVSIKAVEVANNVYGLNVSKKQIERSLKNVFVPARFQTVSKKPIFIIDVAHNPHSIKTLVKNFRIHHPNTKINILLGMLKEKKPEECINILKRIAKKIYLTDVPNPRSFDAKKTVDELNDKNIYYIKNNEIKNLISHGENLIIAGSIYLVGSILAKGYVKIKLN